MIANAILFLVYAWVSGLAKLIDLAGFGDVQPNTGIVSAVSAASHYLGVPYGIVPITTIAITVALGILLVFEAGLGAYKLLKWGYSKIPGIT